MAWMIPSEPDTHAPQSEHRVFRKLKRDLPRTWTVIHGRRYLLPAEGIHRVEEGELDFLVLDPKRGFVGFEVKGGGISRGEEGWKSRDRHGVEHRISDPGRQATAAVHALWRYLARQPGFKRKVQRITFGWGVILPDITVKGDLGPGLPRQLVMDRRDLLRLRESVERIFKAQNVDGPPLPDGYESSFVGMLAPTFRLVRSLVRRLDEEREALVRLTEEQKSILEALEEMPRLVVKGAAGTGKTLLAEEKARRLVAKGHRVLLLCYNRPLADFLDAQAQGYQVQTFHGLCRDLANAAGIAFEIPEAQEAQRPFWEEEAPLKLMEALEASPEERFDAVVVDEGQDFRENWWLVTEELLRHPGKDALVVFYDPNQDLYGGGPPRALETAPVSLRCNCRNTRRISSYAAQLIDVPAMVKAEAPAGIKVEKIRCADDEESVEAVRRTLHRLLIEEKIASHRVVVLSTRSRKKSPLGRHVRLGPATLVPLDSELQPNQVRFGSLLRFKGLEADVVILTDVDQGAFASRPTALYVGATRARHVLVVVTLV